MINLSPAIRETQDSLPAVHLPSPDIRETQQALPVVAPVRVFDARPTLRPTPLPRYEGYISVAPNGRYFQDAQGQGFLVVGQNDAITWPGLHELLRRDDPAATEQYIANLRENGVTVSRVMMEYAQFKKGWLEHTLGLFSPTITRFWDEFIPLCEKHGLYLLLTPYDTFWQVRNWKDYPYSGKAGGPCVQKRDWLTRPDVLAAHKRRWTYILERWGGSSAIFAWDLMNEIDLHFGNTADEISHYITEMAAFVRETEIRLYGKTHLLTASSAVAIPEGALAEAIYNHPVLDFANTHLYVGKGIRSPRNAYDGATEMAHGVAASLAAIGRPRPYFDSESGPITKWVKDRDLDCNMHRHMSFAHLAAGGAGSGMRWPYTTPHCLLPEMRANLQSLSRFATAISWTSFDSRPISDQIQISDTSVFRAGCSDGRQAVIWLLRDVRRARSKRLDKLQITVDGVFAEGAYIVELWETRTGCAFAQLLTRVRDGRLQWTLHLTDIPFEPPLDDLAIAIRPA